MTTKNTSIKLPPLERYFRIMELLCGFPQGLTLGELTQLMALPKATAHRLLATMQKSNLIQLDGNSGCYLLTERVRQLAQLSAGIDFIKTITSSHLEQLVHETGETIYIARLEGTNVRTVVMQSPDAPWRGFVLPGKIMMPHATASGKAILAYQSQDVVEQVLSGNLPKLTRHTRTKTEDILQDYAQIREHGVATCIGEVDEGLAAVAVPISLDISQVIYALGIVGPLPRMQTLLDNDIATRLKQSANAISALLSKTGGKIQ